jgi:predicted DNA-binding transcriptional regulator YafY
VAAAELARRLRTAPTAGSDGVVDSDTVELLAQLNPRLNSAELLLLADAIEHQHDVQITYRNKSGNRTVRAIQPLQLYGRWVESWCHLRDAEREFTVANIESVGPY